MAEASVMYTPPPRSGLPAWNDGWNLAKANSGITPAWVTVIGESIAAGQAATDQLNFSWFGRLQTTLLGRGYARYADFLCSALNSINGVWGAVTPWQVNDVANYSPLANGLGQLAAWLFNTAATTLATYTSPTACTAMDIISLDDVYGGSWSYSLDGGAFVNAPAKLGTNTLRRLQLSGLTNQVHTLAFRQTATVAANILGVVSYPAGPGGTGIGFCRYAYPGMTAYDLARGDSLSFPAEKIINWAGNTAQAAPYNTGFGIPTQPHLAILQIGGNDANAPGMTAGGVTGLGPAMFEHTLRRLCKALRRGRDNCAIVMVIPCLPDSTYDDMTSNQMANAGNWALYISIIYKVAQAFNAAVHNAHAKWGATAVNKQFIGATDFHPTNAGHIDMASDLASIL